jgi:hypothetical protein
MELDAVRHHNDSIFVTQNPLSALFTDNEGLIVARWVVDPECPELVTVNVRRDLP